VDPTQVPGHTNDLETDQLLIPRIYPPLTIHTALVTSKALVSNVATLTTSTSHEFSAGDLVDVTGVDSTFNGRFTITAVTSTTLSYAKTAADVTAVAATGTITQIDPRSPELETDFPGLSEEERSHDGLWVWAIGGVPST